MTEGPHGTSLKAQGKLRGRVWIIVLSIAVTLAVGFELLNAVNEQAIYSVTMLLSMLITTFPLMLVIVVGLFLVFARKRK